MEPERWSLKDKKYPQFFDAFPQTQKSKYEAKYVFAEMTVLVTFLVRKQFFQ